MEDLRENKSLPGITIPKGRKLYAVVDNLNLGSNGPFFLTPEKAIFYAFCVGNVDRSLIPIKSRESVDVFAMFEQKSSSPLITLPQTPNILDQFEQGLPSILKPESIQRFTQSIEKTILGLPRQPGKITLPLDNKNLTAGKRTLGVKYPGKEKVLLSINADVDIVIDQHTMFDPLEADRKMTKVKIGFRKTTLSTLDLSTTNQWIDRNFDGTINFASSFGKYMERRNALDGMSGSIGFISSIAKFAYPVETTAIFISSPQQLFRKRIIYDIDWEEVWESYIDCYFKTGDLLQTRILFESQSGKFVSNGRDASIIYINAPVLLNIISQLDEGSDIVSLCSTNNSFRNICLSSIGLRILREKLQSRKDKFYRQLEFPKDSTRNTFPGIPLPTTNKYGQINHLWKVGYIFFKDDFDFGNSDVSVEKLVASNQSSKIETKGYDEIDRMRLIEQRANNTNVGNKELVERVHDVSRINLSDTATNNIMRNTTSFMCFHAMCMTTILKITDLDVIVNENIHIRERGIPFNFNMTIKTRMENVIVRNPADLLKSTALQINPKEKIVKAINNISLSGSWLHETPVVPFFHNVEYVSKLETLKNLEINRFLLVSGFDLTVSPLEYGKILDKRVINTLTIYKRGEILGLIEIVTCGGTQSSKETIAVMFNLDKLTTLTVTHLRKKLLTNVYCDSRQEIKDKFTYHENDKFYSQNRLGGVCDAIVTEIISPQFDPVTKTNFISEEQGILYYAQYMFLVSFIRTLILNDGADDVSWNTNL